MPTAADPVMSERWRIVIGSDDAGLDYKNALKADLEADPRVAEVIDVGVNNDQATPYPQVAVAAAEQVADGRADRALLVCGTGLGVAISANKAPASARLPPTTASPSNDPYSATTPRCCASGNGSSAWNWPADWPGNGSTTASTEAPPPQRKWR